MLEVEVIVAPVGAFAGVIDARRPVSIDAPPSGADFVEVPS